MGRENLLTQVSVHYLFYILKAHPYPEYFSLHKPAQGFGRHTSTHTHKHDMKGCCDPESLPQVQVVCHLFASKVPMFLDRPM